MKHSGWKYLIPGYGVYQAFKNAFSDGYHPGELSAGLLGFDTSKGNSAGVIDSASDILNDHNVNHDSGQVQISPADPTSSAANVINYNPNLSSQENLLNYATDNNSASAYSQFLANKYSQEMSNTAISRAIADAEANGISKYQLFQSGNMAASSPSSGSSTYQSYENAMNRREDFNEKELAAITAIVATTINSAFKLIDPSKLYY